LQNFPRGLIQIPYLLFLHYILNIGNNFYKNDRRNQMANHLILGELNDFLTGKMLPDTLDERYLQKIAKFLVNEKGYLKKEIQSHRTLNIKAGIKKAQLIVDLVVFVAEFAAMIIQYGPGSLVTRHRPGLSFGRLLFPYQIPLIAVTNGLDADLLDGFSGKRIISGMTNLPGKKELANHCKGLAKKMISTRQAEIETRILFAFEVDGSCNL